MFNQKYFVLISSAISILIVGILFFIYLSNTSDFSKRISLENNKISINCSDYTGNQEIYKEAIKNANLNICSCLKDDDILREQCQKNVSDLSLYRSAHEEYDSNLCEKIENESKKKACYSSLKKEIPTLGQAIALSQKGSYSFQETDYAEKSFKILDEILKKDPDNIEALLGVGYTYEIRNQFEKALSYYNKALTLDPSSAFIYNKIGHLYELSEGADRAITYYQKSLTLSPTLIDAKMNLARIYYRQGKLDKATKLFKEILNNENINNRTFAEVSYVLFEISMDKSDYNEAEVYIEKAKEIDSSLPVVWVGLGQLKFMETKDAKSQEEAEKFLNESLSYFDKAIDIYKNETLAYYWKGRILLAVGEKQKAKKMFKIALDVVNKDISLMFDEKESFSKEIQRLMSENDLLFSFNFFIQIALASSEYQNWVASVVGQSIPGHVWTVEGNTATCSNGWAGTYDGPSSNPTPTPPPPPPTCTYKDKVTEWTVCEDGSQVAVNWTMATIPGTVCSDVSLVQPCYVCGNGVPEIGEGCDDGNVVGGDGCNNVCQLESGDPICGDGIPELGEQCDDGNIIDGDGCNHLCLVETVFSTCGNGIVELGESCDDGNIVSGDGCSDLCNIEGLNTICGNGILEIGEHCDDGNLVEGDGCNNRCLVEFECGNGYKEYGETCDDGNVVNGDGCSSSCSIEANICGNTLCEINEDFLNCPVDCSSDYREI